MDLLLQQLFNGIMLGSTYALVALGLTLVSLSGMVETPRLQAKQVFGCREATYEPRLY